MLVLNLPFKALMFLTLMRPSLVLFLVLWLKLVKDFLKVRCRLDRKSGSAGMPRPISYAVFCLKKKKLADVGRVFRDGHSWVGQLGARADCGHWVVSRCAWMSI